MSPLKRMPVPTIEVVLTRFDETGASPLGAEYSHDALRKLFDAALLQRINNKAFYGEYGAITPSVGPVRHTSVLMENACLRVLGARLTATGFFARVTPSGPRAGEFKALADEYQQPIPLSIRMLSDASGKMTAIVTFDFEPALLQRHPKLGEPLVDTAGLRRAKIAHSAKAAAPTNVPHGPSPQDEDNASAFDIFVTAMHDAEFLAGLGLTPESIATNDVLRLFEVEGTTQLVVPGSEGTLCSVSNNNGSLDVTFTSDIATRYALESLTDRVRAGLLFISNRINERLASLENKESATMATGKSSIAVGEQNTKNPLPVPDTKSKKKKPAKAVFKGVEPIVSKNVKVDFNEVFRVRAGTKFDGYLKKMGGKDGVFVRIQGDDDIYALPYTITAEKKSAGERSLHSALTTRKITIVDTDDLKST